MTRWEFRVVEITTGKEMFSSEIAEVAREECARLNRSVFGAPQYHVVPLSFTRA